MWRHRCIFLPQHYRVKNYLTAMLTVFSDLVVVICKAFFKILPLWQTVRVLFRIVSVFNGLLDPSRFLDFGQDPDPYKTNRDRKHLVAHTHTSCRLGISSLATCYEQKACSPRWSHATNMSNNKLLFYNQSLLNKNMLFSSFVHSIAP